MSDASAADRTDGGQRALELARTFDALARKHEHGHRLELLAGAQLASDVVHALARQLEQDRARPQCAGKARQRRERAGHRHDRVAALAQHHVERL